jgi:hypothetical protein
MDLDLQANDLNLRRLGNITATTFDTKKSNETSYLDACTCIARIQD